MAKTPVRFFTTRSIDEHMGVLKRQVLRSLEDPESRQLAVKIVSDGVVWRGRQKERRVLEAWDYEFRPPDMGDAICKPRDESCEITKMWNFMLENCRYVYDITSMDTFATLRYTLEAKGGDCFPVDTRVIRGDGAKVSIDSIIVGETVFDGNVQVEVLKTWVRGPKQIVRVGLSNGSALRLSPTHKVLRMLPGDAGEQECRVHELELGNALLQPLPSVVERQWVTIRSIAIEPEEQDCVDIMTTSGRVYLPETDVIVRQCDDATISFATLLGAIGFHVAARVITTTQDPDEWVHVYPLVGVHKDDPKTWIPLDITVKGAIPGWQFDQIAKHRDYMLV